MVARPVAQPPSDDFYIEVNRQKIFVSVSNRGQGRPLLLVMGLGGNLELWKPFRAAMVGRETIAFDLPGLGKSSPPRYPMRARGIGKLMVGVIDALGYTRVDVLGISLGGAMAQQLAHQAPGRVRRLVLCATSMGAIAVPGDPRVLIKMMTPRRYYSRTYFERIAPRLYGGRLRREPELMREDIYERAGRRPTLRGYFGQLYAMSGWTSLPFLPFLRQPTLIMAGDEDPIVPAINSRLMSLLVPDARLHIVKGGGHLFLIDQAEESVRVIDDFLGEAIMGSGRQHARRGAGDAPTTG